MEGSKVEKSQVEDCEIEDVGAEGSETENETEESHHFEDSNQMLQINPIYHVTLDPILSTTSTLPPTTSFLTLVNTPVNRSQKRACLRDRKGPPR